jgi:hypothetical protein
MGYVDKSDDMTAIISSAERCGIDKKAVFPCHVRLALVRDLLQERKGCFNHM